MSWCKKNKRVDEAPKCWWSLLARDRHLMIRHPKVMGNKWHLSLGIIGGSCIEGLPLVAKNISGHVVFVPEKLKAIVFIPILDPSEFQARVIEWRSPLHVRVLTGKWFSQPYFAFPVCEVGSLLDIAADHAFWDIPLTGLRQFAKELEVDFKSAKDDLCKMVILLGQAVKKTPLTHSQKIALCRMRAPLEDIAYEILTSAEVEGILSEDDKKELEENTKVKKSSLAKEVALNIKALVADKALHEHEPEPAAASASSGQSSSAHPKPPLALPKAKKLRIYPPKIEVDESVTSEFLESFLPPNCRVFRDNNDQNWRMTGPWKGCPARSWKLYGFSGAAKLLIRMAWERAIDLGYETTCPFDELDLDLW